MDGLNLFEQARAAGLEIRRDGERLVIRGPKDAEALARELLSHKAEIFTALERQPENSCYFCGEPVDRTGADWGAWTDGKTVFGVTVHVRCFNLKFPDGPRGNPTAVNDINDRSAKTKPAMKIATLIAYKQSATILRVLAVRPYLSASLVNSPT